MYVNYEKKFLKQYEKVDNKIKLAFKEKVRLFKKDPFHSRLNNHSLTGKYKGFRSINITGDWRAIYSARNNGEVVIFQLLGTHSQLYK